MNDMNYGTHVDEDWYEDYEGQSDQGLRDETLPTPGRIHEQTGYTACDCQQCVDAREDDRRQWEIEKELEQ